MARIYTVDSLTQEQHNNFIKLNPESKQQTLDQVNKLVKQLLSKTFPEFKHKLDKLKQILQEIRHKNKTKKQKFSYRKGKW